MITLPPIARPDTWLPTPPPRRTPWWRRVITVVLVGAFMIGLIVAIARIIERIVGPRPNRPHVSPLVFIGELVLIILLFPPVVLAHEGGHAIAGTLAGWRLQSLFVGPWRLIRDGAGVRVVWHHSYFYYGGAVVLVPPEWKSDEYIRRSFRQMVAGGPLASLLLAGALLAITFAAHPPGHGTPHGWRFFVFVAGSMSLAIGLGTLIPIQQTGAIRNDGLQLVRLRPRDRHGNPRPLDPGVRIGALLLMLTERRPRDWPGEFIAMLPELPAYQRRVLGYYRELDVGDVERARAMLQSAIDAVAVLPGESGVRTRREAAVEAALFEAAVRGDAAAAREWLALGDGAERTDPHVLSLARAAAYAAARDDAAARHAFAQSERDARRRTIARVDLVRAPLIERVRSLLK